MAKAWARTIGQTLRGVRPGLAALASEKLGFEPNGMTITSPVFAEGAPMPVRYTQDGEGLLPPLVFGDPPPGAVSLALLVEDADAPFPRPLVHAIVHSMPPDIGGVAEGGIEARDKRGRFALGRNSLARQGWLAPSPIVGHGPHRYAFQLLAMDAAPEFASPPGRGQLLRTLRPHLLAVARLIGTYQRD